MKSILFFALAVFGLSTLASAAEPRIFRWHDVKKRYVEIDPTSRKDEAIYLMVIEHGDSITRSWITRAAFDNIVPGSFARGERIRKTGVWAKVWFKLGKDLAWYPVLPDTAPHLWRYSTSFGKTYLSEPEDYYRWDGQPLPDGASNEVLSLPTYEELFGEVLPPPAMKPIVIPSKPTPINPKPSTKPEPQPRPAEPPLVLPDPIPVPSLPKPRPRPEETKPKPVEPAPEPRPAAPPLPEPVGEHDTSIDCRLEVSPAKVQVGETVIMTMTTTGDVTQANLDGAAVDFPRVLRSRLAAEPGRIVIRGVVYSKRGVNHCDTVLEVVIK